MQIKTSLRPFHVTIRKLKKNLTMWSAHKNVEHVTLCLSAGGQHNGALNLIISYESKHVLVWR